MKTPGFIFRAATLSGIAALLFLAGCASHAPAPVVERGVPSKPAAASKDFYTVKKGDTLWAISEETLGSGARYKEIFEANRPMLSHPDKIYPGQVLRIVA